MIKWFDEIKEGDRELTGSKGYNLGILKKAGFNVPNGFVITTKGTRNWDGETQKAVLNAFGRLKYKRVAVRSSAVNEDLQGMSFAGQYETKLNITSENALLNAVEEVMKSFENIRALAYKKQKNIEASNPAIVIQEMIESDVSGVLFTSDPVTGIRDHMIINSGFGIGEGVVSGLVTPDQYTVNKNTGGIIGKVISCKYRGLFYGENGLVEKEIEDGKRKQESLNEGTIKRLAELGRKVEDYYHAPQDIEFGVRDGVVYLLQSRPVTALYPLGNIKRDGKLRAYVNFNQVMQGVKEPFTPLGCEIWKKVLLGYVTVMAGVKTYQEAKYISFAGGRVFIDITNLLSKKWLWKVIAVNMKNKDLPFEDVMNYVRDKYQSVFLDQGIKFRIPLKLYAYFIKEVKRYREALKDPKNAANKCFELGDRWVDSVKKRLEGDMSLEKMVDITHVIGQEMLEVPLKQTMFISGIKELPKLEKIIKKYYGGKLDIEPIKWALPHNRTTEMGLALNELAQKLDGKEFDKNSPEIKEFLKKYGHRGNPELDMGIPRWYENPDYIIGLIKSYQLDCGYLSNIKMVKDQAQMAERRVRDIVETFRKDHGQRLARKVEGILFNFRHTAGLREQPKFDMVRALALLREAWLKQGKVLSDRGLLENPEDIFYLYLDDLKYPELWREKVLQNQEEYSFESGRTRVPRLILNTGETIYTVRRPGMNSKILEGMSVSPGVYEGIVRIMTNPEENIEKGEILVTESTNPAWTPLFITAGALIMESGGPISHGAIVAREYGIPGVVGIPDITSILKTGMKVRVHGDSGVVEILE